MKQKIIMMAPYRLEIRKVGYMYCDEIYIRVWAHPQPLREMNRKSIGANNEKFHTTFRLKWNICITSKISNQNLSRITLVNQLETKTSRDRPKSAPYLRLKNSTKTSKCQVFSFTVPETPKSWTELARPFDIFQHPFCCEISKKLKGNPLKTLSNFSEKKSHNAEKTERGTL